MVRAILDPTSMALLLLAWPLILNLLTIIKSKSKLSFYLISILSTACIAAIAILHGPESGSIRLGNWISFSLDRSSWMFVIVVYLCWSVTLLYSLGYISAHLSNQAEAFHKYMNATVALSVGAGLSDNFFTLLFLHCGDTNDCSAHRSQGRGSCSPRGKILCQINTLACAAHCAACRRMEFSAGHPF